MSGAEGLTLKKGVGENRVAKEGLLSMFWCDITDSSITFGPRPESWTDCGVAVLTKSKYINLVLPGLWHGRTRDVSAFSLNTTTPPRRKKHLFEVSQEHPFVAIVKVTIKRRTRFYLKHLEHVALQLQPPWKSWSHVRTWWKIVVCETPRRRNSKGLGSQCGHWWPGKQIIKWRQTRLPDHKELSTDLIVWSNR